MATKGIEESSRLLSRILVNNITKILPALLAEQPQFNDVFGKYGVLSIAIRSPAMPAALTGDLMTLRDDCSWCFIMVSNSWNRRDPRNLAP